MSRFTAAHYEYGPEVCSYSSEKAKPQRKEMKQAQRGPLASINHLPNGRGIEESIRFIGNDEGGRSEILPGTVPQGWRRFPLNSRENCP